MEPKIDSLECSALKQDLQPLQGTRDFYPSDFSRRKWLFDKWRTIANQYSYQEYDAPIVEKASLWKTKVGNDTDILKEMYTFKLRDSEPEMCLRPEITPSLARMIASRKDLPLPLRWFSIPQCWRYESTTKGRKREFYQWNVDFLGISGSEAELELLVMIVDFFQGVGLKPGQVVIKISDRLVLEVILNNLGISEDVFAIVFNLIDKFNKLEKEELTELFITKTGISVEQISQLYQILESRDFSALESIEPNINEGVLTNLQSIFSGATQLGLDAWLELDLTIVRGLTYYTKTVFEAYFQDTEQRRAILGGGRYDNLLTQYGESPTPAVGFAMGDVVMMLGLEELGLIPVQELKQEPNYLVIPFNESLRADAMIVARTLREKIPGLVVETYLGKCRLKNALDYANKIGVPYSIMIFPDEWIQGKITVKGMLPNDKCQQTYNLKEYINHLIYI